MDLVLGSLVYQLSGGVTLAYDLSLGCTISHWKFFEEDIHLKKLIMPLEIIEVPYHEKSLFRPLKWPSKFRTQKIAKNSKLPKNCFELVGIGG